jgi:hypothetical protein
LRKNKRRFVSRKNVKWRDFVRCKNAQMTNKQNAMPCEPSVPQRRRRESGDARRLGRRRRRRRWRPCCRRLVHNSALTRSIIWLYKLRERRADFERVYGLLL